MIFKNDKKSNILLLIIIAFVIINMILAVFLSGFDWHNHLSLGNFTFTNTPNKQTTETALPQTQISDKSYFDDTVFVGDSITYGLASYGYLTRDHVFAKIGLHQGTALNTKCVYTSKTTSYTIADALSVAKPGKIIITLGVNALYSCYNDSFINNYQSLIDKIQLSSPDSVIILQSVLPVARSWAELNRPDANNRIAYVNDRIAELAKTNDIYYLHTYEDMVGKDGFAESGLLSDGLHLSKKGYQVMLDYILSHTVESNGQFTKIGAVTPPASQSGTSSTVSMPSIDLTSGVTAEVESKTESSTNSKNPSASQTQSGLSGTESEGATSSDKDSSSDLSSQKDESTASSGATSSAVPTSSDIVSSSTPSSTSSSNTSSSSTNSTSSDKTQSGPRLRR